MTDDRPVSPEERLREALEPFAHCCGSVSVPCLPDDPCIGCKALAALSTPTPTGPSPEEVAVQYEFAEISKWIDGLESDIKPGDRVRITRGEYSGRTGMYDGYDDVIGVHKVCLDGEPINDPMYPPVPCDTVEKIDTTKEQQ